MRGIIYARQSKKEQEENSYSIKSQIEDMTKFAQEHNIELPYPPIVDLGVSGKQTIRPGTEKLWEYVNGENKLIDCILVLDADRLGRHKVESLYFMWILNENQVKVITKDRQYDMAEKPTDYIVAAMDFFRADEESKHIGERTQRGKKTRFKAGNWVHGYTPEGYEKKGEWLQKKIGCESVVLELFTKFKETKSYSRTKNSMETKYSQMFNKELTIGRLKRILQDPVYIGQPRYGDVAYPDSNLAMIDKTLYNEVQQLISRFSDGHASKKNKNYAFEEITKKYGLGFALRTIPEFIPHCECGGHMLKHGGSITKGYWVTRFKCDTCGRQETHPTGAQIDQFKNITLLSCPYCRETEYFEVCKTPDVEEYLYKCLQCAGSFKSTENPNRYLRKIASKKDPPAVNHVQQEDKPKKQVLKSTLDVFT